ncbi:hypothetical protein KVT40_002759 [Elsinoe batatas]|uniref:BRCT domain-containing protein n=1 Tax=Elsinoe batatas TaxID=2601811 RepID=A0A8K0L394_9PEZI|nr:hypothetical protein KVT40_002759 [Elsinoe batatas]
MAPPNFPTAAKPKREIFDPWNSSSTGHQRAENRLSGSTSWRDSRSAKLSEQFRAGLTGGKRVADTVGAGSESFVKGERTANGGWKRGVVRDRGSGQVSLWESFGVKPEPGTAADERATAERESKRMKRKLSFETPVYGSRSPSPPLEPSKKISPPKPSSTMMPPPQNPPVSTPPSPPSHQDPPIMPSPDFDDTLLASFSPNSSLSSPETNRHRLDPSNPAPSPPSPPPDSAPDTSTLTTTGPSSSTTAPQIFRNLTIYINGSTYPLISDHKLKHLLSTHGANLSISLGRRTVTHVILGLPSTSASTSLASTPNVSGRGAGGALAAGKIQKEISRVRSAGGKGPRYVSAEWVLECVRRGKRVGEGGYEVVATGGAGQRGVGGMLGGNVKTLDGREGKEGKKG